ncbi:MAG TPA: adenine phosphoribosyltransferase [Actinomycetales bacterium]|nr:adenine phosphoribosyltransferase [Actinomycetales bacterium]
MDDRERVREQVLARIRDVPDFPKPGVVFKDITPLLADHAAFSASVRALTAMVPDDVDVVAAVEARGFVFGAPVALALGAGLVPVRKVGKLPGTTTRASYELEYGTAEIEVVDDAFSPGQRVVVLDDVLATGGTAAATCELVEQLGADVVAVRFLLELSFLSGREKLVGRDVDSLAIL